MKRIILLVSCLMLIMQVSALAAVNRTWMGNYFRIESKSSYSYQAKDGNVPHDCALEVLVVHDFVFNRPDGGQNYYIRFEASKSLPYKNIGLMFSRVDSPRFEILKNGRNEVLVMSEVSNKIGEKGDMVIDYLIKKDSLTALNEAKAVTLIMPTLDGGFEKFEIPEDILEEWQYVMTSDTKKEVKEMQAS